MSHKYTCIFMALCVPVFLNSIGYAQVAGCTVAQAKRAEDQIDRLHTWDSLYKWYKAYRHCDDGGIAEGISEDVGRMLAHHWSTLPNLDQLARQDAGFKRFVIRHVDATLGDDDLQNIRENAILNCPRGLHDICGELKKQTRDALGELASFEKKK